MTLYYPVLFVHIIAAIGLFTAIGLEIACLQRLRHVRTAAQVKEWCSLIKPLGVILPVSSLVILLAGIYMLVVRWGWTTAWADLSLLFLLVLSALGSTINGRRMERIAEAAGSAPEGELPEALRAQINDPILATSVRTMTSLAVGIVFLMTVKPALVGSLVTMGIALVIGLLLSWPTWREQRTTDPRPNAEQTIGA